MRNVLGPMRTSSPGLAPCQAFAKGASELTPKTNVPSRLSLPNGNPTNTHGPEVSTSTPDVYEDGDD